MLASAYVDNRNGYGEDAEPVNTEHFSAVFDGMGGAGGAYHNTLEYGKVTSAYIASRLAARYFNNYFTQSKVEEIFKLMHEKDSDEKKKEYLSIVGFESIQGYCENVRNWYGTEQFPILLPRSKTIKFLPTTMAGYLVCTDDPCKDEIELIAIWAGDSRCFLLTELGLQQISLDDNNDISDYYHELLYDSAPMKNCLNMSKGFYINIRHITVKKPCIVFAATDGCFMYFEDPFLFEKYLLRSISKSETLESSLTVCKDMWIKRAYDDCSIAVNFFGFDSFDSIINFSLRRNRYFNENHYILLSAKKELKQTRNKLVELEKKKKIIAAKIETTFQECSNGYNHDAVVFLYDLLRDNDYFDEYIRNKKKEIDSYDLIIKNQIEIKKDEIEKLKKLFFEKWLDIRSKTLNSMTKIIPVKPYIRRLCLKKAKLEKQNQDICEYTTNLKKLLKDYSELEFLTLSDMEQFLLFLVYEKHRTKRLMHSYNKYKVQDSEINRVIAKLRERDNEFFELILSIYLSNGIDKYQAIIKEIDDIDERFKLIEGDIDKAEMIIRESQNRKNSYISDEHKRFIIFLNNYRNELTKWILSKDFGYLCYKFGMKDKKVNDVNYQIEELKEKVNEINKNILLEIERLWSDYRIIYEEYLMNVSDIVKTDITTTQIAY